jgi:hypothetical protein
MAIYDPNSESQLEAEMPLSMRMMENIPGITASAGFSLSRGTGTIMRGGYMDFRPKRASLYGRTSKFRVMDGAGGLTARSESQFLFGNRAIGRKRAARLVKAQDQASFFKSARVNNATLRPRALTRYHSLSIFGDQTSYTPFKAGHFLGRSKGLTSSLANQGIVASEGENLFGSGILSIAGAGVKADRLEAKLAKRSVFNGRLEKKLARVDRSAEALARMNIGGPIDLSAKLASGAPGARGDVLASVARGRGSQFIGGYARGALGHGGSVVGEAAEKGVALARTHMAEALSQAGIKMGAGEVLEGGVLKKLGYKNAAKTFATKEGAKVLGARAAALAIPGINVIATASLLYDLGKMGGELVKSGINLARDAGKSLKGDIAKPLFGAAFKDNEAAATSRARGVMAIQNSQLNARSVLGSEGALMAAHFG